MIDSVAIVSGGIDSVTLLHHLVKNEQRRPAVITFAYGQKHVREIECARTHARSLGCTGHQVLDLQMLRPLFAGSALVATDVAVPAAEAVQGDPQPITYVPNRNMIFLALAVAYAESHGAGEVFYGAQQHDLYGYWDCTPQFLEQLNRVYRLNRKNAVRIRAPFVDFSKADILRRGLSLQVDYAATWSCYEGRQAACGKCPTCTERLNAFAELGVPDPLPYDRQNPC